MQRFVRALFCAVAMVSLSPAVSHAGGFETARFGSDVNNHAAATTPLAVYYNPAALSGTRKLHIAVDGILALHGQSYDRTSTTVAEPNDAVGANTGKTKSLDVLGAPSVAASLRLGEFNLGIGFYAPLGGAERWQGKDSFKGNTKYVGAQDGPARWHAIDAQVAVLYTTLAASYVVRPLRLSIGASANLIYGTANLTRAQAPAYDDDLNVEGRSQIEASGVLFSFGIGALWEAIEKQLWVGLSYQAPPGLYGGMTLEGTVRKQLGGTLSKDKADLHQTFADIFRWAVRYRPDQRYELRLSGDYQRWSLFERQCVSLRGDSCKVNSDGSPKAGSTVLANYEGNFKDTFGVRAGASYWFSPKWEAFASLGFDSNAIPAATLSPLVLDGNDISIGLGGRIRFNERYALLISYTHIQWFERDIKSSRLALAEAPTRLPDGSGTYNQWAGILDAFFEVAFD